MIKFYQWFDFRRLKKDFSQDPKIQDLIDSLEWAQRKNSFYEHYHVHSASWKINKQKVEDELSRLHVADPLQSVIHDMMDDYEQIQTERDMYEQFWKEETKLKSK